jgi:hypothetical protein
MRPTPVTSRPGPTLIRNDRVLRPKYVAPGARLHRRGEFCPQPPWTASRSPGQSPRFRNLCDTLAASYQRASVKSESPRPDDIGVPILLHLVRFAETAAGAEPD